MVGNSNSLFDNTNGKIKGGLSEHILDAAVSNSPSGVAATLTFTIAGYGNSPVTINGGYLIGSDAPGTPEINVACNSASVEVNPPVTSISIYQSGSTTNANIQYPALQDPIGASFSVDLYITGAIGIWGWSLDVTWDPNVLKCTSISQGSYLSPIDQTFFGPGYIDNYLGKVDAGISCAYSSLITENNVSGVLATLTFQILTYSDSALSLTQGSPATLFTNTFPTKPITPAPILTGAQYTWAPGEATGPTAVITTEGSPLGSGSNQTWVNYPLTLDGSQSLAGLNMVPPYQNCPITIYHWSITLADGMKFAENSPRLP